MATPTTEAYGISGFEFLTARDIGVRSNGPAQVVRDRALMVPSNPCPTRTGEEVTQPE